MTQRSPLGRFLVAGRFMREALGGGRFFCRRCFVVPRFFSRFLWIGRIWLGVLDAPLVILPGLEVANERPHCLLLIL